MHSIVSGVVWRDRDKIQWFFVPFKYSLTIKRRSARERVASQHNEIGSYLKQNHKFTDPFSGDEWNVGACVLHRFFSSI